MLMYFVQTRGHVVLILDKDLQCLPWESIPTLRKHSVSRMPSIDALMWQLRLAKSDSYQSVDFNNVSYVVNPKVRICILFDLHFVEN